MGVPEYSGQEQLETFPGSICKNLPEIRYSQYRSFCIPDVSSTLNLHDIETRSRKSSKQCHVSTMGRSIPMCLSSILPNTPAIVETKGRRDYNDIGGTNMAITSMIFSSSEHACPQSTFIAILEGPTSGHIRKNSSFSSKPDSTIGSLVGFWKSLAPKSISDKWAGWRGKWEVDPFPCPVKFALDYLSDMFEKGMSYRTILYIDLQHLLIMNH